MITNFWMVVGLRYDLDNTSMPWQSVQNIQNKKSNKHWLNKVQKIHSCCEQSTKTLFLQKMFVLWLLAETCSSWFFSKWVFACFITLPCWGTLSSSEIYELQHSSSGDKRRDAFCAFLCFSFCLHLQNGALISWKASASSCMKYCICDYLDLDCTSRI